MRVSLIVAMSSNRVIGRGGQLPWRLSADLRRFKQRTMGHHIIMGRKTFESIGRLLPGRTTIVVTRQADYVVPGAVVRHGLHDALRSARGDNEVFVIGGGELYQLALPLAERIYLTIVKARIAGDTYFPAIDSAVWRVVSEASFPADDKNEYPHTFQLLEKRSA